MLVTQNSKPSAGPEVAWRALKILQPQSESRARNEIGSAAIASTVLYFGQWRMSRTMMRCANSNLDESRLQLRITAVATAVEKLAQAAHRSSEVAQRY